MTLRRSKGGRGGHGATKRLRYASIPALCRVPALARWLETSESTERPLCRGLEPHGHLQADRLHPCSVVQIVKRCAERAGFDPNV